MLTEQALQLIKTGQASCVVVRENEIIHTASGPGVSPLMALYREEPDKLKGSLVLDKIIGKAAAVILVLGNTKQAFGEIMSVSGRDYLIHHDIQVEYGSLVDAVINREGNGICPLEQSVVDFDDPRECFVQITAAIKILMEQAG